MDANGDNWPAPTEARSAFFAAQLRGVLWEIGTGFHVGVVA
jgi:hypothetical protein